MSHSVTITRTTTTTSGSALFINTGYLRTLPGLLKLAQLILGAVCVGIVGYYWKRYMNTYYIKETPELFFLLMATTFLIGTFCLFTACICSLSSASLISKTLYEVIYHGLAFILYLAASITLLVEVNHQKNYYGKNYEPFLAASVIGLILAGLYLFSAVLANKSYRGI